MNVPVASNSASSAVTSAVISGSGVVDALLVAATTSFAPILMPVLASTVRSGVAEPQDHQVGQVEAVVDVRGHQQRHEVGRQRRAVDRHREGVADLRLGHVTPRP